MKRVQHILTTLAISSTLFFSCSDDFLDKNPTQEIASGTFWTSQKDVEMALTGCYARLKGSYLTWQRSYFDAAVDNGWAQHYNPIRLMQTGTLDAANSGAASSLYAACYQGIAMTNVFLKNMQRVSLAPVTASQYEAEAKFLRALYYFELVQRWGGVVIYDSVADEIEKLKVAKSSEEEVYDFIDKDLKYAIANLPDEAYRSGHAVKASALALQARIALFKSDWDTVISSTKSIIDDNKFSLAQDLSSPFIKRLGQSSSPEILFSIKYIETRDGRQSNDGGQEVEFFRWGGLAPTKDLIDQYEQEDLRVKTWYYYSPDRTTYTREDGFKFQTEFVATNYGLTKFFDVNEPSRFIPSERDIITGHDIVLFRLADVYLMYAEALLEKSSGHLVDQTALGLVNQIRERAGVKAFHQLTRQELRDERRRELAFEGLRYFDIVRWKAGASISGKLIHSNIFLKWEDKFYKWPFSQSELDINTALKQNENY